MVESGPPQGIFGRTADDELVPGRSHVISRLIFYLALLALVAGLVWAYLTPVDMVIRAPGALTAEGGTVPLTVSKSGMVKEVHVKIGDMVRIGDPLIDLDPLVNESELAQTRKEIGLLDMQIEGHNETARIHREEWKVDFSRLNLKIEENEEKARNYREDVNDIARKIEKTKAAKEIQFRELETYRKLAASGEITPLELNRKELEVNNSEIAIIDLQRQKKDRENLAQQTERLAKTIKEIDIPGEKKKKENLALQSERLAKGETLKKGILQQKLQLLENMRKRLTLRSTVNGKVVELAVIHPGIILGPSQPAVQLLPENDPIVAIIHIENTQIRQAKLGMDVVLRLQSYPYQNFGEIRGKLSRIDPKPDKNGFFLATVSFDDEGIPEKLKNVFLRPGLSLEADIIGDQKKMIDFVLEPFQKLGEPMRVRGGE